MVMKPIDIAYMIGVKLALRDHEKLAATGDESSWWKPLLGAAGFGAGAYALARTPFKASLAKHPILRKIQEMAGGKMFRSSIRGAPMEPPVGLQKVKRSLLHGPEAFAEGLPQAAAGTTKKPTAVWGGHEEFLPKTFDPSFGPVTGETAAWTGHFIENLSDKLEQARLLAKHAPGTMGKTFSVTDIAKKYGVKIRSGRNLPGDLKRLQGALEKEFGGKQYLIKTREAREGGDIAAASSGVFPTGETDLAKAYGAWKKMRPEYQRAVARVEESLSDVDINKVVEQFRKRPGFEGRLIDELLHKNVIFQEKLPLQYFSPQVAKKMVARGRHPAREYRVHVVGGKAIPSLARPRFYSSPLGVVPEIIRARRAARWAQKNVIDKLTGSAREIGYGMDIAPLKGGGFKVIELNPGGASGLLDYPLIGNPLLHKAVTGRHTRGIASLLGLGGVGAGAGITGAVTD